jgi:CRP/FNR family cyclic AMP-dependent transcriptional regulator
MRARRAAHPTDAFRAESGRPAVRIADEDPALLGTLSDELLQAARHQLVARTLWVEPGRWEPLSGDLPRRFDGWLGVLVLDGLLVRQVELEGLICCELLGPGDILRPWDEDDETGTIECHTAWRVLEPTRLALLDAGFARRACRWPTLTAELLQRTLRRSRSQSILLAITQARRADVRLRTLFSHLADRWGRVTPDGIVLPLRLTHSVIAQLTGLRRPSVSISLAELERSGEIVRLSKDAWLITRPAASDAA